MLKRKSRLSRHTFQTKWLKYAEWETLPLSMHSAFRLAKENTDHKRVLESLAPKDEDKGPRDILPHCKDGLLKRVSELHRGYDPLQYILMFVKGEDGYYLTIQQQVAELPDRNNDPALFDIVTMRMYTGHVGNKI
ncbi:hypothetical protein EVAR_84425_1 [Eumeta japonica]|uniref:Uncharacterized protein n=1 Tax=Eumeta variegata TaxID=151549 RepID=A0A4C1W435_EUMVA|nr:hypothetical protein EVAR_84425_1 [Eumeta japonica]